MQELQTCVSSTNQDILNKITANEEERQSFEHLPERR